MEPDTKRQRTETSLNDKNTTNEVTTVPVSRDLYLDTIDRHMLDFDFEKVCSVSMSNINIYACLVCGNYFQGRGKSSHAYFHSMHKDHHVFLNLHTLKVYILPDGYEVDDPSLNDIKYVLNPTLTKQQVSQLDQNNLPSFDLNNKKYIPGFVGLNNIKANDYVNVVIQALVHIPSFRDFFILQDFEKQGRSQLVTRFGSLVRKMWNPRAYKGQVSPHELLQEISSASGKRFKLTTQGNAIDFLSWFLNTIHRDLGGSKKQNSSIVYQTFQGQVQMESQEIGPADNGREKGQVLVFDEDRPMTKTSSPFLFLALDLPPAPLYQDEAEANIIPQVPLTTILNKYDGVTVQEITGQKKRYQITRLPRYIIFNIKRFNKNNFTDEKNPTIVNFPIKNIDMAHCKSIIIIIFEYNRMTINLTFSYYL
ncbi:hypothetical protein BC941DRAFT_364269 [Chlamydoabsidia padenii]|nr:hypothetical protein BC941DRAFT_364269 [Chlamydoabsidia padenii]